YHMAGRLVQGKLKRRKIIGRIESLATLCGGRDATQCLEKLTQLVAKKAPNDKESLAGCSLLMECLSVRSQLAYKADQWLVGEAVVWGFVWFTRSVRVDSSAGKILEDLVQIGEAGLENLFNGEFSASPFLLTCGGLLKDVDRCQSFVAAARKNLFLEVQERVGDDGGVGMESSFEILTAVNRWARCREVIHATSGKKLGKETNSKIDQAVGFAVLLLSNSGQPATECGFEAEQSVTPILQAASCGRKKVAATVLALTDGKNSAGDMRWTEKGLCERSLFDEVQKTAVFRSGWKREATRVLVSYRDEFPYLEIVAGGRLVVAGRWDVALRCDGKELQRVGEWRRTWWDANDRAVYFEMSVEVEGGRRLERSVLLLPKDKIVLLADALVVPELKYGDQSDMLAAGLQLRSSLSVAPSISIEPCEETCEVFGSDGRPRFLAIPLALEEWRESCRGHGSFGMSDQRLELKQNAEAGRLYAPLWIDCNAGRLKRLQEQPEYNQRTWRQLTVADTRETLRADQAVSFRVQSCLDQWFVYRSLDEARNRTALGCNTSSEFLVGGVAENGVVKRLLEVVEDRVLY
ncbi:MAG: hypothetical protein P8J43_01000, partial [Pirellulales bacterium]|nr:hypothetical protein [Pirellulales bacterium]